MPKVSAALGKATSCRFSLTTASQHHHHLHVTYKVSAFRSPTTKPHQIPQLFKETSFDFVSLPLFSCSCSCSRYINFLPTHLHNFRQHQRKPCDKWLCYETGEAPFLCLRKPFIFSLTYSPDTYHRCHLKSLQSWKLTPPPFGIPGEKVEAIANCNFCFRVTHSLNFPTVANVVTGGIVTKH